MSVGYFSWIMSAYWKSGIKEFDENWRKRQQLIEQYALNVLKDCSLIGIRFIILMECVLISKSVCLNVLQASYV